MTPEVMIHVGAGALGLVSGAVAVSARKGERLHRGAGSTFILVMGTTAASGIYLGLAGGEPNNAIAGIVTLYLLATAWMTVRRIENETGAFEIGGFLFAALGAAAASYFALQAVRSGDAMLGGVPYVVIATIITLAAFADLSVLLRRGLSGRQRIARHLWRMLLGFSAAVRSFFPGQLQIFPDYIQQIRPIIILFIPFFLVIGLMFFWLLYVLLSKRFERVAPTH
jgi:uncharacterized membrane protein